MPRSDSKPGPRGAFFGRRKGHPLRPHQAALMESLLPRLALDLGAPPPDPLAALFPGPAEDIGLEIGFRGGEHLAAEAAPLETPLRAGIEHRGARPPAAAAG